MYIEIIGVITILMALRAVITFFISSTIGSNAIAYALKDLEDEITFDKNMEEHEEN